MIFLPLSRHNRLFKMIGHKKMITVLKLAAAFILSLFYPLASEASGYQVNAYVFHSEGCPHCRQERQYLGSISSKYPSLTIREFEVAGNSANRVLMASAAQKLGATVNGVPFLVIGDQYFIGFSSGATESIEKRIALCASSGCEDPIAGVIEGQTQTENKPDDDRPRLSPSQFESVKINVPFFGEIDAKSLSLPAITVILGALDGFNPCAMWTLVFLISLLLGTKDKKKMWIFGITFIAVSAFVYFLFMAAWLNLVLFFGFIVWVRVAIGGLALAGSFYILKDYYTNRAGVCKIGDEDKKEKLFNKLKAAISKNNFWLGLAGIIALAFAVNLVELICSAGLPAIYSQILALNNIDFLQRYLYLALYIIFFMADDLLVFIAAMVTMQLSGFNTKYTNFSRLIGGLMLLAIGILLIFKPEWLMFG